MLHILSVLKENLLDFQTGFVETLKPQYIPGQVMISPGASSGSATVEEKLSNLQNQQEIENLKSEVVDLQEKIETLKGLHVFSV
jgi:dynactin 1